MPALTERAPREVTPTTEETSEAPRSVESPISETELGNQAVSLAADLAPALGTVLDPLSAPLSNHVVARRLASANGPRRPSVLTLPKVSKPTDPFEREASIVARTVAAGEASTETVLRSADETAAEAEPVDELRPDASVALAAGGMAGSDGDPSEVDEETASLIAEPGAGMPIPSDVREQVEAAVDADLSGVTVHTDEVAAAAAARLSARAFTYGSDIYLGEGESPDDLELMAHESVHVVQQGAAEALGRMVDARYGDGGIQRDWLPDIPTSLADFAEYIPGFDLFCLLIGFNPFTGGSVPPTPENLIQGLMGIAPGGRFVYDGLAQVEAVQPAFAFVQAQVGSLGVTGERIETLIDRTWDQLDLTPRLGIISENVAIVERNFGALLDEVVTFATDLIDGILEFIKEAAVDVAEDLVDESPTWEVIKEVIHYDPLRDQPVDVPTVEILEHVLVLLGKQTEVEQMKERGTLQETADWLDTQFATFDSLLSELKQLVTDAWNAIQPENLPNILSNLESLAQRALGFFQRVVDFGITLALTVLRLIKDALLSWLSDVAHETPGFHLITVILGQNPFTQEEVPRTAENLIKGFITLLPDGEAVYADLSETGVIGTAAGNIEAAVEDLGISWELITGTFLGIWDELTLENLIEPVATFERIVDAFGEPIGRILEFIQVVFEEVIRLIAALTGFPGGLIDSIVTNAMAAYEDIKSDPAQFFSNMIEALETGFSNFFDGFLGHLLTGLVEWLMGTIEDAGLTPPADLSFESVLTFVLEVLDISVERMWSELAERIGQERVDQMRAALDRLMGIFAFVRDVVTEGPAAIWSYIEDQLSGLWDTILEMATEWIMETIITRVTAKLLSMLDPSGIMAAVNTCIAVYNAIESAIQYMTAILEVIDGWVSTLASVARGDVGPGAERVEGGMAASIPIAIGFLANQVGLDNLGEKIAEIVAGIRELVDQAIDWLMDQALAAVQSLAAMLGVGPEGEEAEEGAGAEGEEAVDTGDPEHDAAVNAGLADLRQFLAAVVEERKASREEAEGVAARVRSEHSVFTDFSVVERGGRWDFQWAASDGAVVTGPEQEEGDAGAPSLIGKQASAVTAAEANAAGYRKPHERDGGWVVARLPDSDPRRDPDTPPLSVGSDGKIVSGSTAAVAEEGEGDLPVVGSYGSLSGEGREAHHVPYDRFFEVMKTEVRAVLADEELPENARDILEPFAQALDAISTNDLIAILIDRDTHQSSQVASAHGTIIRTELQARLRRGSNRLFPVPTSLALEELERERSERTVLTKPQEEHHHDVLAAAVEAITGQESVTIVEGFRSEARAVLSRAYEGELRYALVALSQALLASTRDGPRSERMQRFAQVGREARAFAQVLLEALGEDTGQEIRARFGGSIIWKRAQ